jgi:hypothetical protein
MPRQVRLEVEPVVHLLARHHEGVAGLEGLDGQEGHGLRVAPHEAAG